MRLPHASTATDIDACANHLGLREDTKPQEDAKNNEKETDVENTKDVGTPFLHLGRLRIYGHVLNDEMRFKLGQRDHNNKRRSFHAHTEEDNVTPELSRSLKDSLDEFSASLRPENSASYADFKSVKSSSGRLGLPLSLCTHNRSVIHLTGAHICYSLWTRSC